jgi:hypothetical protein
MHTPAVSVSSSGVAGYWHIRINDTDMTFLRGVPVVVGSMSDTDPFGAAEASLSFPMVSPLEPHGIAGTELEHLREDVAVEIIWVTTNPNMIAALARLGLPPQYHWPGFIVSFGYEMNSAGATLTANCIGALRALDNLVAQPVVTYRPVPYEAMIVKVVNEGIVRARVPKLTRMGYMDFSDVPGAVQYHAPNSIEHGDDYQYPIALANKQWWSGMVTREQGQWDRLMTGYVQSMLTVMYTRTGRISMRLIPGTFTPQLFHLDMAAAVSGHQLLVIDVALPGVEFSLNRDFAMTMNALYGSVSSTFSNTNFTNQQWSYNGSQTWYEPFAETPYANIGFRREQYTAFADGLQPYQAISVAHDHVSRNADPGLTGTVTLTGVDPSIPSTAISGASDLGGVMLAVPKQLLHSGMAIRLDGFGGRRPGPVVLITGADHNIANNSISLTVDAKFRDYLTVAEVAVRGRDALTPLHQMTVGNYSPTRSDRLIPWDDAKSGYIPNTSNVLWSRWATLRSGQLAAVGATGVDIDYPWVAFTRAFPPKTNPSHYIKIAKAAPGSRGRKDDDGQWIYVDTLPHWSKNDSTDALDYIGRMCTSSTGTLSSLKMMCVDENGKVLPVSFWMGLYYTDKISSRDTPKLPSNYDGQGRHYKSGAAYPMFPYAWSKMGPDGVEFDDQGSRTAPNGLIAAFGTYWDRPGYWPRSLQMNDGSAVRTGLFVNDADIQYDHVQESTNGLKNLPKVVNTLEGNTVMTVLIFCDDNLDVDKYFIGRAYHKEASSS